MSLRLYGGEFLIQPIPLHLGMNVCSHGCFYCFANLNNPNRRLDATFVRPLIKALQTGDANSPIARLVMRGHPILVSNTVDPFAKSNYLSFIEIHDALYDLGCRFTYQTKGGEEAALSIALDDKPTMFYVSITSDDSDKLKSIEPGAPSFEARMELVKEAKRRGHHVVIGINPFVQPWWKNAYGLLDELASIGVRHLWIQPIHLSRMQIANIPIAKRAKHNEEISEAQKKMPNMYLADIVAFMDEARSNGFLVYGDGESPLNFWDDYEKLGFPFWPTLNSFFKTLEKVGGGLPVVFGLDDFMWWMGDVGLPERHSSYKEFVQKFQRSIRNVKGNDAPKTMREVMELIWDIRFPTIFRHPCLSIAGGDGGETIYTDSENRHLFVYVPDGNESELFDIDASRTVQFWVASKKEA